MTTNARTEARNERLRSLTDEVKHFDPSNPVHLAHFNALREHFGDLNAAMIVSQDAAISVDNRLWITDSGEIASWAGWQARNRVVIHGSTSAFTIYDFDGNRIIPLFVRNQTVPAYAQPE